MLPGTAKIISICKRNYIGPEWLKDCDTVDALQLYVSFYTGNGLYHVTIADIKVFLREAVIDYISSSETQEKTLFINNIYSCIDSGYDEVHAYISSLRRIRVRNEKHEYINGFSDLYTREVDLLNGEL